MANWPKSNRIIGRLFLNLPSRRIECITDHNREHPMFTVSLGSRFTAISLPGNLDIDWNFTQLTVLEMSSSGLNNDAKLMLRSAN
jgi:hypothetical protein